MHCFYYKMLAARSETVVSILCYMCSWFIDCSKFTFILPASCWRELEVYTRFIIMHVSNICSIFALVRSSQIWERVYATKMRELLLLGSLATVNQIQG